VIRFTLSRYTPPDATEPVYDVLVGGCASGFRPLNDAARAIAYLERVIASASGWVEVVYWDGDAGVERDSAESLIGVRP
jgi:hypothetical protein